jgi:glycerophosphoryl diester phosphodiesterase
LIAAAAAVAVIVAVVAIVLANRPDDTNDANGADGATKDPSPSSSATAPPKLGGSGAPVVLAHRGGNEKSAWQTIPAFEHAASIGAAIETDVRWSKDDIPVLMHDRSTTPGMVCKGGSRFVDEENWSALRDNCVSPAGADGKQHGITTLDQAAIAVSKTPGAVIYPEIKVKQTAKQARVFVSILQSARMTGRSVVTSAIPEEIDKIHAYAQKDGVDDLRLMQFVSKRPVHVADLASDLWGVAVEFDVATKAYVQELKDADLKVMVWNINTEDQWAEATRVGADIVMTDEPAGFGKWFEAR